MCGGGACNENSPCRQTLGYSLPRGKGQPKERGYVLVILTLVFFFLEYVNLEALSTLLRTLDQ